VGGVVADQVERLRIAVGENRDLDAIGQWCREVAQLAADANRQRCLGQPRPDRRCGVGAAGALAQLQRGAIRELDRDLLGRRLDPLMLPTPHQSLTSSFAPYWTTEGEVSDPGRRSRVSAVGPGEPDGRL
jgi:hypothetical protein